MSEPAKTMPARDTIQLHRGEDGKVRIGVFRDGKLSYWNGWGFDESDDRPSSEIKSMVEGLLHDAAKQAKLTLESPLDGAVEKTRDDLEAFATVMSDAAEQPCAGEDAAFAAGVRKANDDFDRLARSRAKDLLKSIEPRIDRLTEMSFCLGYKAAIVDISKGQASEKKP